MKEKLKDIAAWTVLAIIGIWAVAIVYLIWEIFVIAAVALGIIAACLLGVAAISWSWDRAKETLNV